MHEFEPYRARPIRFHGVWKHRDWRIKIYGISSLGADPETDLFDLARDVINHALPQQARTNHRYGVGFVTIHEASAFHQIIVDWWEYENELRHRVFKSPPGLVKSFTEITATGEAFCIWELRIIGFERETWLKSVLQNQAKDGIDRYLDIGLSELT